VSDESPDKNELLDSGDDGKEQEEQMMKMEMKTKREHIEESCELAFNLGLSDAFKVGR